MKTNLVSKSEKGSRCPGCNATAGVRVYDVRTEKAEYAINDRKKRRKECKKCTHRWVTYEIHKSAWDLIDQAVKGAKKEAKRYERKLAKKQTTKREKLQNLIQQIEGRSK
jgi:transcriptional regulator NrdR family protein